MRLFGLELLAAGLLVSISFIPTTAQDRTTLRTLLENPAKYNARTVRVAGTVIDLESKVSARSTRYTTFALLDEGFRVEAFLPAPSLALRRGERVEVLGQFYLFRNVDEQSFHNVIEVYTFSNR